MNKCLICKRPFNVKSKKKICTHCKSKGGNHIGKGLLALTPVIITLGIKKFMKK